MNLRLYNRRKRGFTEVWNEDDRRRPRWVKTPVANLIR
jgi:hypothetical protein